MAKESITIQSPVVVNKVTTLDSPVVVRSSSTPVSSSTTSVKPVSQSGSTVKKSTRSLKQVLIFDVPPPPLYESFIDAGRVSIYTQCPAKIVPQVGGSFELFGGAVTGQMLVIENNRKIVQKWRFSTWPSNHFSEVSLEFEEQHGRTQLTLTQTGIPSEDYERTKCGWEEYFWVRIRGLFGWHYKMK
eukprot:TRINITY_DN1444_c0_g1_i3.p1 TRINITY_DN1444_c0_g1~~TRINITY_DN1444_c0_g1_i3.p1  ORF type:complete len:187 (+),score=26.45 TRINITY_DN1444_c0_g1_i3:647-1207(+)